MPKKEKIKILKVIVSKYYLIPILDDGRTKINGWDMKQVIKDWFEDYPMSSSHATRDTHEIGNSEKVIDVTQMNPEDTEFWKEG